MAAQTITAQSMTGRISADGERAELEFATEDGPVVVAFPRAQVIKLLSHAAQLNLQPAPQPGVFVPVEAFPLASFTLSGTEAGDYLLAVRAVDRGLYTFVFDHAFAGQMHEAFGKAMEAPKPGSGPAA